MISPSFVSVQSIFSFELKTTSRKVKFHSREIVSHFICNLIRYHVQCIRLPQMQINHIASVVSAPPLLFATESDQWEFDVCMAYEVAGSRFPGAHSIIVLMAWQNSAKWVDSFINKLEDVMCEAGAVELEFNSSKTEMAIRVLNRKFKTSTFSGSQYEIRSSRSIELARSNWYSNFSNFSLRWFHRNWLIWFTISP